MSTKVVRRKVDPEAPSGLAREAYHHILCRPHTAETLARALAVSVATVSRALAELRRTLAGEGASLVSLKEGASWRYEIREKEEDLWETDPFVRSIGFASNVRRPRGQRVDDALYGRPRRSR
jgi:hypothetical protein